MASISFGVFGGDALQDLDRLVAAVGGVEIGGKLDLRVALERRTRRHALVDLDRHLRLLHGLIEIGERQQRQRMIGLQIERELQIDQRQILAAAAGQRGADAVQRLGRAGLRRIDQRRQLLAGLGVAQAFLHQRMPRQLLVERFVDAGRRRARPCCATASAHRRRTRAASNRRACRRARTARRRPFPCPRVSRIMPAWRSLKIGYHSGPVSLSIPATAALASPAP